MATGRYGIVVKPQDEPYARADAPAELEFLLRANLRRGHDAYLAELNPPCGVCDERIDGWYQVDENGDLMDVPLHDSCWRDYWDERNASHYV